MTAKIQLNNITHIFDKFNAKKNEIIYMQLSFNKTTPILTLGEFKLYGWDTNKMPSKYSNQNAIVFSNDGNDPYIEKNLFEIIKNYSITDFPDANIEILIEPIHLNNEPEILKRIPYPFTGLKIGIKEEAFMIAFDLIQEIGFPDNDWNKKWTQEFYFDSFIKVIKHEKEVKIKYNTEDFFTLEIILLVKEKTINGALEFGIKKINEIINKVEYSINGLSGFFEAIEIWKDKKIIKDEFFWHTLLKKYSWLLSLIINEPAIIVENEAYIGGKSIKNNQGNVIDFVYQSKLTNNLALIEIKTPQTKIIGKKYRSTYSLSSELTGSINQLLNYKDSFQKNFYSLVHNSNSSFNLISPNCYLIIGNQESMSKSEKECFELYRKNLANTTIITFDELFEKAFFVLTMIQQ